MPIPTFRQLQNITIILEHMNRFNYIPNYNIKYKMTSSKVLYATCLKSSSILTILCIC